MFCSNKCAAASRRKYSTCAWCGCQFWNESGHTSARKFCCAACHREWRYENQLVPILESGDATNYSGSYVRKYLQQRDGDGCGECGQHPFHNGKVLTLQIDHVDGNSDNNEPANLRLLCPNCHSQTATFGWRGVRKDSQRNNYLRNRRR